jgi:hypothetical protein
MTEETEAVAQALQATKQVQAVSTTQATAMTAAKVGLLGGELKKLAEKGGFAVDDTTGDRLIEALEGVLEALEQRWANLQRLHDAPALSRTAAGQWVSSHMVNTAADEHGLLTQLEAARREFPTYVEAIKQAKKNYQSREEETRVTLTSLPAADQS